MKVLLSIFATFAFLALVGMAKPVESSAAHQRSALIPLDAHPVLPMAQTVEDCGKPQFNSNNTICHSVGRVVKEQDEETFNPVDLGIARINEELKDYGHLSVRRLNYDGFPIFEFECNKHGRCFNATGVPAGTLKELAAEMETITQTEASNYGYRCHIVCYDGQNHIVGAEE